MWRRVVLALLVINAVSALAGASGLIGNGVGMDEALLQGTAFDSYTVPGILLAAGIGLPHAVAAVAVWRRWPFAPLVAMVAAFGLNVWIYTQVTLIGGGFVLQWLYWALSLVEIGAVAAWLGLFRRHPAAAVGARAR